MAVSYIEGTNMLKPTTPHLSERAKQQIASTQAGKNYLAQSVPQTLNKTTNKSTNAGANTQKAVRDYMVNTLGFDNGKIGFNNGIVTYNGQDFLKPSYLTDGTSYADQSAIDQAASDYRANNASIAVRDQMIKDGFYNDLIGWNAGTNQITYNGVEIGSPAKLENGKSYQDEESYNKMISNFTKDLVNAADYAATLGNGGGVQYTSDGKLTYLGQEVPIYQIKSDGQRSYAYVKKSDLDNISANFQQNNPTIVGAFKDYKNNFSNRIERALEKIENQKEFEYDLKSDPSYQAYLAAAKRNGEEAYEDTLAKNASMTGGFSNSNAIVAAQQAKQGYLDSLNDRIPQLYQAAYDRYNAERSREFDRLSSILGTGSQMLENQLQAAAYLNQMILQADQADHQRRLDEENSENLMYERQKNEENTAYQRGLYQDELARYYDELSYNKKVTALNAYLELLSATNDNGYLPIINSILASMR